MAPIVDERLPANVYSWRVKKPFPKAGPIFRESDISDLPYLKKGRIRRDVDPFAPWYALWPQFDDASRNVFLERDYRFLATSDIAAYFENIQLPILRDQFLHLFPDDPTIVNMLMQFLEAWSIRTADGRIRYRGIPQGNFISSFLGNAFLLPLDEALTAFANEHDILYYRYMDDVRIFTKTRQAARLAIFQLDRTLRSLHLNVQTAKTKIYDESQFEISKLLIDERADELNEMVTHINSLSRAERKDSQYRAKLLKKIDAAIRTKEHGDKKIIGAKRPLEGLTLRTFYRWVTAHALLQSDAYIPRLLKEIERSADSRLTKRLWTATRIFPRKRAVQNALLTFLDSDKNIFPFQEAECLRAIRYLAEPNERAVERCHNRMIDPKADRYLRIQAAYLLSRTEVPAARLKQYEALFDREPDPHVQAAVATVLIQRRHGQADVIKKLIFHSNGTVRDIGKLLFRAQNDQSFAQARLKHALTPESPWLMCDNMAFLHAMAGSPLKEIRTVVMDAIEAPSKSCAILGLRNQLQAIHRRLSESVRPGVTLQLFRSDEA